MPNEAGSAVGIAEVGQPTRTGSRSSTTPENSMSMIALPTEMCCCPLPYNGSFTMRATGTTIDAVSRELFALQRANGYWKIRFYMFNRTTPA